MSQKRYHGQYQIQLENTISILLQSNHFFGILFHQCSISWTFDMPTAAVRVDPKGTMEMFINPEFFSSLTEKERVGLILHELYHIVSGHLASFIGLNPDEANIAMDVANNQYIPAYYLPPGALTPENVVAQENQRRRSQNRAEVKLPPLELFQIYYNILRQELSKEQIQEMQNPHQFQGELDQPENSSKSEQPPQAPSNQNSDKEEEQMKKMLAVLLAKEAELEAQKVTAPVAPEVVAAQTTLAETSESISDFMNRLKLNDLLPTNQKISVEQRRRQKEMEGKANEKY